MAGSGASSSTRCVSTTTSRRFNTRGRGSRCTACAATRRRRTEHTFASLDNVKGFPGPPTAFSDDGSWRRAPGDDAAHANPVPPTSLLPARQPDPAFLQTFTSIPGRAVLERADAAVGDVRSCGRAGRRRAVHQLQPVHVVSRRTERAVRADDVPAVAGGAARHRRRRERLAVRRMAVVADGAGRARSDLLRPGGERARVPRLRCRRLKTSR